MTGHNGKCFSSVVNQGISAIYLIPILDTAVNNITFSALIHNKERLDYMT